MVGIPEKDRGQGTIEYLVIIAIVIVISLLVALFFSGFLESNEGSVKTSGKISGLTRPISIVELVADSDGNVLIILQNNTGTLITLNKIRFCGIETNYAISFAIGGKEILYSPQASCCTCDAGETTHPCDLTITSTTPLGLVSIDYYSGRIDCTEEIEKPDDARNPIEEEEESTTPIVYLLSPANNDTNTRTTIQFDFNAIDDTAVTSCTLIMDGSDVNTITSPSTNDFFSHTITSFNDTNHTWDVECSDGTESATATNGARTIMLDHNAYEINDCLQLQDMNLDLDGNYLLMNDINCYDDTHAGGALYTDGNGFIPIGDCGGDFCNNGDNTDHPFEGNFDGNNKIIYNLLINKRHAYFGSNMLAGLFGFATGTISNIGLLDVTINGTTYVGGLVGVLNGTVTNSHSTGDVNGMLGVGGLIGAINGAVTDSYSTANVNCSMVNGGGLVGISRGAVTNSYATGNVQTAGSSSGGLIGQQMSGTTANSYATGNVTTLAHEAGGLIGYLFGTVTKSYATGNVSGDQDVGGLVGHSDVLSTISNSFSTGLVTATTWEGGGVGQKASNATFTNLYWDGNRSNQTNCYYGGNTGCTKKNDTNTDPFYFYVNENAPLSAWGTWSNTSGKLWETTDGNWSICRADGYPWLTFENRSC